MAKNVKISCRQTKDYELLKKLDRRAFPIDALRDFQSDVCWLIKYNNDIVGYFSLEIINNNTAFLSRVGIFKHGCGLHRRAINVRIRWCKKHNIKKIITYAHMNNFQSIVNLIRCGFRLYIEPDQHQREKFLHFIKTLQ